MAFDGVSYPVIRVHGFMVIIHRGKPSGRVAVRDDNDWGSWRGPEPTGPNASTLANRIPLGFESKAFRNFVRLQKLSEISLGWLLLTEKK